MNRAVRIGRFCMALLFPERCAFCGEVIGFSGPCAACAGELAELTRPAGEPLPREGHVWRHLKAVYAPYHYGGIVRGAVLSLKFYKRADLALPLAREQAAFLRASGEAESVDAVCFVPRTRRTDKKRRYDVPHLLARELGKELGKPVLSALVKVRETVPQKELSREERRKNVSGAFAVQNAQAVRGKRILLVDDIVTTGATLEACAEPLLEAGAAACIGMTAAAAFSLSERKGALPP